MRLIAAFRLPHVAHRVAGLVVDVFGAPCHRIAAASRARCRPGQRGRRARNARGYRAAADVFGFLRTHHHRFGGIVSLLALLGAGKIAIRPTRWRETCRGRAADRACCRFWRATSCSSFCRYSSASSEGSGSSAEEAFRARFSKLPRVSSTETASGSSPSTALATNWQIAATFWRRQLGAGPQLYQHTGLGGLAASPGKANLWEK